MNPDETAKNGLDEMLSHAEECIKWRSKAHELEPTNREYTRLLANATMGLGQGKTDQQQVDLKPARFVEAEKLIETSQSMREKLLAEKSDDGLVQSDFARGYIALADLRIAQAKTADPGDADAARALLTKSLELRQHAIQIFEELPPEAVPDSQADLANCYQSCATDYAASGDYDRAVEYFESMGLTLQPLLLSNPGIYRYRKGVADAQFNLAQLFLKQQDDLGWDFVTDFQKTLVNALIVDPRNHDAINLMVDYSDAIAAGYMENDLLPDALKCLKQAKTLLEEARLNAADGKFIETTIKRIDDKIEALTSDNRTA